MQEIGQNSDNNNKIQVLKQIIQIKDQKLTKSIHYSALQPLDWENYSHILEFNKLNILN